jgi:dienelactone hydrolase
MKRIAFLVGAIACVTGSSAQDLVKYKSLDQNSEPADVVAVFSRPSNVADPTKRLPAVVLLHSGGGWELPVTGQYAKALNAAGFATIEPRLFRNSSEAKPGPSIYLPQVFGALHYLASRSDIDPGKITVAGFSYGGVLALNSATAWSAAKFGGPSALKFAAHAPFYPICWSYVAFMKGKLKAPILPSDMYAKWTGMPVRIFAGGLDDYDDRDPKACEDFVAEIPAEHRSALTVKVYPNATHGWDQPAAEFQERLACKGRGCVNRNIPNPSVTSQSISDLVEFFVAIGR